MSNSEHFDDVASRWDEMHSGFYSPNVSVKDVGEKCRADSACGTASASVSIFRRLGRQVEERLWSLT